MKKLTLHPYSLSGALIVASNLIGPDREVIEALTGRPFNAEEAAAETLHYPGMHWIAADAETPHIACGFIRQRGVGGATEVYRTWFFSTPEAWTTYLGSTTRIARSLIQSMLHDGHAHRIETLTLASYTETRAWYDRIGLTYEATLRQYGAKGEDVVIYSALAKVEIL